VENKLANKIIMLQDLVDKLNGRMVIQIVKHRDMNTIFKHRPKICPHCQADGIIGVEVMGAEEHVLLWECSECQCVYLKFDKDVTEKELQEAREYWTNPDDWGHCPKSEYN
jgi:Zn ribbon nucleic-acid-binding protein